MNKEENGQVSQAFRVVYDEKSIDAVTVFYRISRDNTIYKAGVRNSGFTIFADKASYISLFAVARGTGKTHVAHTDMFLFADSVIPPERERASQAEMAVPFIELVSPEYSYWNQTGQEFRFKVNTLFNTERINMTVLENGRTHDLLPHQDHDYLYVPPHDLRLREEGYTASRQDILLASITDGSTEFTLTYSLLLHRSRYAFDNQKAGAAVFGLSIVIFAGWIMIKRRGARW